MIDADFLDQLSRFNLVIQKRVTSNYSGMKESASIGHGLVFADYQQYVPGDDFRYIDWKVLGRTDKLFIRRFEEERSQTVHIMTDASASMNFMKKWDYAAMLSVGFAYLTMKENEKFQFSVFSNKVQSYRAYRGRTHLAKMVDLLNNMHKEGNTDFIEAMRILKKSIFSKSVCVIISDFLFDPEDFSYGLQLIKKNDIKCIMVLDAKEYDLDFLGEYNLKDSETKGTLRTHIGSNLRSKYKHRLDVHISEIQKICDAIGAEFYFVTTGGTIFDAFYNILKK